MLERSLSRQSAPPRAAPTGVTERGTVAAPAGTIAGPSHAGGAVSGFGYGGEPAADKKKSDDNGGGTVPAGPRQFNPTTPNTDTSGTPMSWVSIEKPQKPEWDNGVDEAMAKRFGGLRHSSLAELGTNLTTVPAKLPVRYSRLTIGGHGNANMMATGSGDGDDVGDALNLKESNKATWLPYFSRDKFYGRAEVWLMSCNVGNGPIPQLIADQSGSTVHAYTRSAFANEKAPWD